MVKETTENAEQRLVGQQSTGVEGAAVEAARGMKDLLDRQSAEAANEKDPSRKPRPLITGEFGKLDIVFEDNGFVVSPKQELSGQVKDKHPSDIENRSSKTSYSKGISVDTGNSATHTGADASSAATSPDSNHPGSKTRETEQEVQPQNQEVNEKPATWEQDKANFEKEHGVKVVKNKESGQLEYHVTANGKDEKLCESKDSPEGMKEGAKQLDAKVAEKEQELHKKYGVTIAQPGDKRAYDKDDDPYKIRPARINELYALDSALEHSKPTSFNGIKIEFVDKKESGDGADQGRAKDGKGVSWDEHDGQQTLRITPWCSESLPVGTSDLVDGKPAQDHSIEGYFIHELAHASESRWSGDTGNEDHRKPVYKTREFEEAENPKMGWAKSEIKNGEDPVWLLKSKDGYLYQHDDSETGGGHWTRVNKKGEPLDADGQTTDQTHAFQYDTNAEMREQAKVRPSSEYFDNPAEEYAEAMMYFRMNRQARETLLAENPELYKIVKETDQQEINQKYGLDSEGNPNIVRGEDGRLLPKKK